MPSDRACTAGPEWPRRHAFALLVAVALTACQTIPQQAPSPPAADCRTSIEPIVECRLASCEELARAVDSYEAALRNEAQHAAEGATLMIHPGFLALFPLTVPIAAVAIVQHHHFVAVLRAGQAEARRLMRDKGCAAKPDPAPNQPAESQANRPEPQ